ncbi:Histone-arginine methyltransferase CARMER [Amphibalanus amphitrite]|uniref:type I protein arginine methyltransferase n=1 Tax=Amphibalanus amphitrite TaxID=1232801 RepID=A0A6A4W2A2_AMPAM|nr:Histone-arginine methyltransferase CARMER [Amphibalanus amphitrite]
MTLNLFVKRYGSITEKIVSLLLESNQPFNYRTHSVVSAWNNARRALHWLPSEPLWRCLQRHHAEAAGECSACSPLGQLSVLHFNQSGSSIEGLDDLDGHDSRKCASDVDVMMELGPCRWLRTDDPEEPPLLVDPSPPDGDPDSMPLLVVEPSANPGFVLLFVKPTSACDHSDRRQDLPRDSWKSATTAMHLILDKLEKALTDGTLHCFFWTKINILAEYTADDLRATQREVQKMRKFMVAGLLAWHDSCFDLQPWKELLLNANLLLRACEESDSLLTRRHGPPGSSELRREADQHALEAHRPGRVMLCVAKGVMMFHEHNPARWCQLTVSVEDRMQKHGLEAGLTAGSSLHERAERCARLDPERTGNNTSTPDVATDCCSCLEDSDMQLLLGRPEAFYSYLSQQQNMLQDFIRTGTYQRAILSNAADFTGKVVLDVGAGSGILSFFAAQAGAKKVYAVEASSMSEHAARLVAANNLQHVIQVVAGKIEEINLAEKVDMIISEPMGYMLYNERMLETYLHAKKWLKPGGKLFPSRGDLHIAPFRDDALYMEQYSKANFWYQNSFHGVNLTSLRERAAEEYFRQPVVDTFDVRICLAKAVRHVLDFSTAEERDLHRIDIPVEFHMLETGTVHGLAFWFDVAFCGSQQTVWLSTAPTEPLTHWYQVRCLLRHPLPAKEGQMLTGRVLMVANQRQSYDVTITLQVEATGVSSTVTLDLKNPLFRYTGAAPAAPPGYNSVSPSEKHWATVDAQGAKHALSLLHGMTVNGLGEVAMDTSGLQNTVLNVESLVNQAAIHPGSIPAAALSSGRPVAATSAPKRPAPAAASSRATAVRPAQGRPAAAATTADPAPPQPQPQQYPLSQALMIGDYVTLAGSFRQ